MDKEYENKSVELEKFVDIINESDPEHITYKKSVDMLDELIKKDYIVKSNDSSIIRNKLIKKEQSKKKGDE